MKYHYLGAIMRTTINIEDNLIDKASRLTGINEKTSLVKLGLEALIAREWIYRQK
jgi:Arc/MetJ family transcription regulator